MKKVCIVINKNWEAEPIITAMVSNEFRASALPFPSTLESLKTAKHTSNVPRAVFQLPDQGVDSPEPVDLEIQVWCLQDLMDKSKSSSSSEEKYRVLPPVLRDINPDLVIAVGTAGYISESSYNGCVVVGGRFFVHNGNHSNPASKLDLKEFETLLPSNINKDVFGIFNSSLKQKTEFKFLKPPINPAARPAVLASPHYTALGSVNVTDYSEYAWVDKEAIDAFRLIEKKLPIGSLETTHGVIRLSSNKPCMFVTAITDREGHFDAEVTPSQNYICSFNAGIVLGQFLVDLNEKWKSPAFQIQP